MICRMCGCSEERACKVPVLIDGEFSVTPCSWLVENLCTHPNCVTEAYLELRELVLEAA